MVCHNCNFFFFFSFSERTKRVERVDQKRAFDVTGKRRSFRERKTEGVS